MPKLRSIAAIILLLAGLSLTACALFPPAFKGSHLDPPLPASDFALIDQDGQPFRLSEEAGEVTLLFFGYTHCPDVCPTTLAVWNQVYQALGDDAERVRFIFITVDPERDTPESLKHHVAIFNPNFIGLTGPLDELEAIYQVYGVYREIDTESETAAGYLVSHTGSAYVLDAELQRVLLHRFGMLADDIVSDLRQLLD